jgi:hypothetical protein
MTRRTTASLALAVVATFAGPSDGVRWRTDPRRARRGGVPLPADKRDDGLPSGKVARRDGS